MRPPALMRGPSRKPRCQASGGPDSRATSMRLDKPRLLAPAQHLQSLGDEGAIEPDQRHHVGDGAERHVVEQGQQIGFGPRIGPKTAGAQLAIDRHHRHEHEPDRGEITEAGEIVAPVRIDDGQCRRQRLVGLMMVDDDDIHAERLCFAQRLDAGGAAIDGHQQRRAARRQRAHRLDIRAVAFEQPVGNVNDRLDAATTQETRQHGGGCRAVHIVVAENRDALAAHNSVGDARGRFRHGGEHVRIGHRALDRRIEKGVDRVGLDIAAGEDARQQFGDLMALRDRQRPRRAALVEPVAPSACRSPNSRRRGRGDSLPFFVIPGRATRRKPGIHHHNQCEDCLVRNSTRTYRASGARR